MPARPRQPGSIKRQVLLFALLICVGIMLPVGVGLFAQHQNESRRRLTDSLEAIARITAANVSGTVAFAYRKEASEILAALRHEPLITGATIYDLSGERFAGAPAPGHPNDGTALHIEADIVHEDVRYGRLVLCGDISGALRRTARTWIATYAGAILAAAIAAFFIARRFHRTVGEPIIQLAATADRVTRAGDYTVQAVPAGCTEVAHLAEALNDMLAELERRDAMLAQKVAALAREVREREGAEKSLRDNQQEMLRLSREAGMAEVAAGVLHNIGNALNSINVSGELLNEELAGWRRRRLGSLHKLFAHPTPQAAAVFNAHPDGQELRAFAASLADPSHRELASIAELASIMRTGIAHLKEIVASQQSLARTTRLSEPFDLCDALHDALVLARTTNRPFSPVEETGEGPTLVYADRGLTVQILLNLLINAHESVSEQRPAAPLITVRVGPPTITHVAVAITDNGVGIPEDRLVSIFNYGFTTKRHGHGFGLHNSANAAKLMNGRLTVQSPGPGEGATFTFSLPRQAPD